jgi:phage gp29-like protein
MTDYVQLPSGMVVPASFAEAAMTRPESREIATTRDGRDITRGFVSPFELLMPQDEVLRARGMGNYQIYREVLRDDQVAATFAQRRLAVISREWEVQPGGEKRQDKAAAAFLKEQLQAVGWDAVCDRMLYGVFYGHAVAEILWGNDGRFVTIDRVKVRDRRRFGYDGEMNLRLLTMANPNPGEPLPERKFWSFATGADHDDEPYGLGLAHWLYWPVFFKRGGIKFWLIFLEKFGQPTAKGSYPPNATPEEKSRLLAALGAIMTDAGVILPEGMAIELIEAARSGTADYTALYDRMNNAIAKVVLGQTLTTEAEGGQYKADVQMDVRQDLVKSDADLICASFNRSVARWLTEWNFPGAAIPRVWRQVDEGEDLDKRSQVDQRLHEMGYEPETPEYINETYGGRWVKRAAPGAGVPQLRGAAFAEGEETLIDRQADRLAREAAAAIDEMIEQIRAAVEQAQSLPALREALMALYPALDTREFTAVMQRALAAAALAGRYDLIEELR